MTSFPETRRRWFFLLVSFLIFSCGVKGRPLPPLEPPYIGNGKTIQENENLKKKAAREAKNNQQSQPQAETEIQK